MSVVLQADSSAWLEIPQAFPTGDGESAEDWEDRVIRGMREAWNGALDESAELIVRESLRHACSRVLPEDSVTLQYWPRASVANAVVHVVVGFRGDGEVPISVPLDGGPFVVPPRSEKFSAEFLGDGIESRALTTVDTEPPMVVGSLNFLFENADGYVFVGIDKTLPALVGLMQQPLRDIVRSIRVLDDDGRGPWAMSVIDESVLADHGETWNFNDSKEAI